MTLKCLLLFGQIVLQSYGRPCEIPSAVRRVLVELRGRRLEKDLVNTGLLAETAYGMPFLPAMRLYRPAPHQLPAGML